ncbi:MAG: SUMF1/EgtB/PvdO family nonheme iron enzyme [Planctomycetota bacterium]
MRKYLTIAAVAEVVVVFGCVSGTQAQVSPGDMNCDGQENGLDIPLFVDCVLNGNCDHCGVVIETVTVGNPGNAGEWSGESYGGYGPDRICGAVGYTYNIGKYEVTAGQYAEFLNAVAATDTYGLYNPSMDSDAWGCQITRNGSDGNYTYDFSGRPSGTEADWADRPVNFVSWGDAARFANWLHNGQPTGAQDLTTTEDGSYYLDGAMSEAELLAITREPDATRVIPSEDEWYKAAYHKNDGVTGNYFDYPTSSDSVPGYVNDSGNLSGTGTTFTEGGTDPGNYATFDGDGGIDGIGSPYYRTEVGEWEASASTYGTFDQGGNVWEWNEAVSGSYRGLRGASFHNPGYSLHAAYRNYYYPLGEISSLGFRVADVSGTQAQVSPGDMNCDGTVDGLDIPLFVDCVVNGNCDHCGVVIETVTVGNPGNAGEWSGESYGGYGPDRICGAVDYVYNIGKFEVTAGQYTKFLNAVAATDTYGLYNENMDGRFYGCQITQNGTSGSYTYDFSGCPSGTEADWADRPVNYVSWGDAARFANWLHNGQPTGAQDLTTTEDGSYYLDGAITSPELMAITREADATWVIPSEDEWYKAAYHKNDGVTGNYFDYPTSSDSVPGYVNNSGNLSGTGDVFTEGGTDPGNYATYDGDGDPDGIGSPYYRTAVGEWENSDSPYGTFDQGGNVWEWNEAVIGYYRGVRGGSFIGDGNNLHAAIRADDYPPNEKYFGGFRVAEVP